MPWKETCVMDQRTDFVFRVLRGTEPFRSVCREYGISSKTGYKWLNRFLDEGVDGLDDRSKRPNRHSKQLPEDVICKLIKLKLAHSGWGPKKIMDLYRRQYGSAPCRSSVHRVLKKSGLVKKRRRRKAKTDQRLINRFKAKAPNDVWTVDFKGWWNASDGKRCEPLTVRDDYSRYILTAVPLKRSCTEQVKMEFERLFNIYGLPRVIRSDNGVPFASPRAVYGLSRLSAWFMVLGIQLDRIRPGCPYENGRHERMHRDISSDVQAMANGDLKSHAASLEVWRKEFNEIRPHEALDMKTPAEVYSKSSTKYKGTPDKIDYPNGFIERKVNWTGYVVFYRRTFFITSARRGWTVGLKPKGTEEFDVHFLNVNLGSINLETSAFIPGPVASQ